MTRPTLFDRARKAYAAFAAGVVSMLAAGLITGDLAAWITGAGGAIASALAVYRISNTPDRKAQTR